MTKPLSREALSIWNAFNDVSERVGVFEDYGDALAAALRAINEHVVMPLPRHEYDYDELEAFSGIHQEIERLAKELEEK
jgi:hypothetical protein